MIERPLNNATPKTSERCPSVLPRVPFLAGIFEKLPVSSRREYNIPRPSDQIHFCDEAEFAVVAVDQIS
jgi:hypothetical protein